MVVDKDEGRPCLSCEKCDGFSLHVWRKRCRNCFCKREEHDVVSGGESASENEEGSPEKRTMDFNSGARRGPQSNDPSSRVKKTGKKWVRPPAEVESMPQRPAGTGKKWAPPAGSSSSAGDEGSASGYSGKRWNTSAEGGSAGGPGSGSSGPGSVGTGAAGGAGADARGAIRPPAGFEHLELPPPPPPGGPGGAGGAGGPGSAGAAGAGDADQSGSADRHVSFQLDRNTEHAADMPGSDSGFSASAGAGGVGASAGVSAGISAGDSAGAGGSSGGKSDFDIDIDFDVDKILANAGLDMGDSKAADSDVGGAAAVGGAGAYGSADNSGAYGGAGGGEYGAGGVGAYGGAGDYGAGGAGAYGGAGGVGGAGADGSAGDYGAGGAGAYGAGGVGGAGGAGGVGGAGGAGGVGGVGGASDYGAGGAGTYGAGVAGGAGAGGAGAGGVGGVGGAGAGAGGADGSSTGASINVEFGKGGGAGGDTGDADFPEFNPGDLPDPLSELDSLLPPSADDDSGAAAGGHADGGASASGPSAAFDMPSTQLVVSSYTWVPVGLSSDETNQFLADIPLEFRPFDTADGRQKSNKWRQEQNPPHDIDPAAGNNLNKEQTEELKEFIQLREQQNHGIGKATSSSNQTSCDRCHKRFAPPAVVVEADRLPNRAWHPHCFTCKTCDQFLSQLEYYASDSDLYCGRHHAELTKPRCGGCDELILVGSFTKAQDKTWHAQHFCCISCDRPLATDSEKEEYAKYKDQVVCLKCYGDKFALKCDACQLMIPAGAEQLGHGDRQWHIECFCCFKCQSKLDPDSFLVEDGKLWCEKCFTADKGARCTACDQLISPSAPAVSVGDRKWHESCFQCAACRAPLAGQEFFDHPTGTHCSKCYGDKLANKCRKCGQRLGPEGGLTYNDVSYHPACFTCGQCGIEISTGEFVAKDDELYCKGCFTGTVAPRCNACDKPITSEGRDSNYTSHEGKSWHNTCFSCCVCATSLVDAGFLYKNQKLHCKGCVLK